MTSRQGAAMAARREVRFTTRSQARTGRRVGASLLLTAVLVAVVPLVASTPWWAGLAMVAAALLLVPVAAAIGLGEHAHARDTARLQAEGTEVAAEVLGYEQTTTEEGDVLGTLALLVIAEDETFGVDHRCSRSSCRDAGRAAGPGEHVLVPVLLSPDSLEWMVPHRD